jgi:citrate lyase beta subunit
MNKAIHTTLNHRSTRTSDYMCIRVNSLGHMQLEDIDTHHLSFVAQIIQTIYIPKLSMRPYTGWLYGISNHTSTIFSPS